MSTIVHDAGPDDHPADGGRDPGAHEAVGAPAVVPIPRAAPAAPRSPSLLRELRQRLLAEGAGAMSDLELVTVLMGRGTGTTARRLLATEGLVDLALHGDCRRVRGRGVGAVQAATLAACFELGRRVYGPEQTAPTVSQASDAHAVTRDLELARREYFVALYLDARNRVLVRETVSVGSLNASIVHPREVFRAAVRHAAASVILAHNHPSGNPEPSPDDIALTRRLAEAGRLLGIEVLDHLIIGRGSYVSLKTRGIL